MKKFLKLKSLLSIMLILTALTFSTQTQAASFVKNIFFYTVFDAPEGVNVHVNGVSGMDSSTTKVIQGYDYFDWIYDDDWTHWGNGGDVMDQYGEKIGFFCFWKSWTSPYIEQPNRDTFNVVKYDSWHPSGEQVATEIRGGDFDVSWNDDGDSDYKIVAIEPTYAEEPTWIINNIMEFLGIENVFDFYQCGIAILHVKIEPRYNFDLEKTSIKMKYDMPRNAITYSEPMFMHTTSIMNIKKNNGLPEILRAGEIYPIVKPKGTYLFHYEDSHFERESQDLTKSAKVIAQSTGDGLIAENVLDGRDTTRWSSEAYNDNVGFTLDLGKEEKIDNIMIKWERAYARDYIIYGSRYADKDWQTLAYVTDGHGGTDKLDIGPTKYYRYIKLVCVNKAEHMNNYSIYQFNVFGGYGHSI